MKKLSFVLVILVILGIAILSRFFPLKEYLLELVEWVRQSGSLGVVVYALLYVSATVLFLPGSLITLAAGSIYGPFWGTVLVSPASVLGASLAFLISRFVARDFIEKKAKANPKFGRLDQAIGEESFKIILLLRLSPIFPFNFLNYALGLTRARFRDYVLASFLGMLPGTVMFVYFGSLITTLAELFSGEASVQSPLRYGLYALGFVATVVVTVVVTKMARRTLSQEWEGSAS